MKARSGKAHSRGQAAREHVARYVVQAYPARVADAITIAASAASVAVAAGHAREAGARIGVAPGVPVLWRVEARFRPTALRWKRFTYHNGYGIIGDWEVLRAASGHNGSVEGDVKMYEFWRLASMTEARVPPMLTGWKPWSRFVGERFADVPNPLEPALAVWALGFGLNAIHEDAIVLVTLCDDEERSRRHALDEG